MSMLLLALSVPKLPYISIILFVIFGSCVATLWTEGMWGNAIQLINVVTAALLATNYFEPLANTIQGVNTNMGTYTYVWDFLSLWGLFVIILAFLRFITDKLSRVRVKFLKPADQIGSFAIAAVIGWVMVCFTAMSLHMAPLGREYLVKSAKDPTKASFRPEVRVNSFLCPEIRWLGFFQRESKGAFCRMKPRTFDPNSEFLPTYTDRRANLEYYNMEHNAIRIRTEHMNQ